ncbi:MAG TPA: ABC transporter permease [Candidatus Limnocylindrales bacterium]|nr:ABC transporter permease [Candidatus Limnocylindrales bacterium]
MTPVIGRNLRNVFLVAKREYLSRVRTRTFIFSTVALMVLVTALAVAPIAIAWFGRGEGGARVAVYIGPGVSVPASEVAGELAAQLNTDPANPVADTSVTTDLAGARARVVDGGLTGVLDVERSASGDLAFTYITTANPTFDRLPSLVGQATNGLAVRDRLDRLGISAADQAGLFAKVDYETANPAPESGGPTSGAEAAARFGIGFGLTILIFMAILLYGQWIAQSVAEEKSSRVMEVILNAASPFQLLGGKVAGVGVLALTQYVLIAIPAGVVLLFQGQIRTLVLGSAGSGSALPPGLSVPLLATFGLFFLLGFGLYSVLYAAAGSLVSRQEELNQLIGPLTMISTGGYLIAAWSASGILDLEKFPMTLLSYVPFLSPYLMLARFSSGGAGAVEVLVAAALLAVTIVGALWVAARIYSAGVLLYGQQPGFRKAWAALRAGR